ncbi:hypothetical protein [Streptomyces sp. NPDC006510]|uniref:hypothetical protein n=1 Tax=Streptomyces sp. NPDC006510 TaxID=3155600 RepID=UPI00339E98B2
MSRETPIYNRLVAEQGDVPAEVRGEAQRIERDLEWVIRPTHPPVTAGLAQRGNTFRPGI